MREAFDRFGLRFTWGLFVGLIGLAAVAGWFGVEPGPAIRYGPLLLSLLVFGLPHGAVDHLVPARFGGLSLGRSLGVVGLGYAVLGGLYLGLWLLAPLPAAALFIAVTWLHWGQGDVHALIAFVETPHLASRGRRIGTLVVRGGLPMLVPLIGFPGRYQAVLGDWLALFSMDAGLAWAQAPTVRTILGAGFLLVTFGILSSGYRSTGNTRAWRIDAGETALLWTFFLVVPPLVAIGVYFSIWHALRHVFRLVAATDSVESPGPGFGQFAREAAPLTALAVLLLVGFWFVVPASPTSVSGLVALYLVFIAVLTVPHVAVVAWMDHREGIWVKGSATPYLH
ncbi:MAG: Brp/Blh family beta-carotene 15,15'-dioxygenase [Halodesulfurarchaeum sp.]